MTDSRTPQESITALAAAISGVIRGGFLVKHHAPPTVPGLDHGALPVLFTVHEQQRRVSDIAAACHTDVSTTSRYVTALTRLGLVSKAPDEQDRRAFVITVTDEGRQTVETLRRQRAELFAQILHDWDQADLDQLTADLERLVTSVDTYLRNHRTTKGA
ncbi:MarR family winged helix-turn-helix transcriptional regulator [Arsenicicoccus sp. oral taxon 190]|uniref:MarR family winged helix-turn-helix transcriptional regulator n=1 Tax=Arsenicicoccus sp. oral taxon 190 TaxID=1658671 RepID=UPI00067B1E32|nr:MarR family transcriptional regulator [Arsenicicoccus sp. oral taxon 190]